MWSGLAAHTRDTFERIDPGLLTSDFVFADLDLALEAAEARILERHTESVDQEDSVAQEIDLSAGLLEFFERQSFPAGTRVLEQGDSSDAMYVVLRGTLTAWRQSELGTVSRLRRFSTGSIIGEISFIRGGERTADVSADTDVELLQLSRDSFDEMRASQPDAALELQGFLLEHVSKRLTLTTISLASAMDDR
jgi:CRP-like cAMP-binding protein